MAFLRNENSKETVNDGRNFNYFSILTQTLIFFYSKVHALKKLDMQGIIARDRWIKLNILFTLDYKISIRENEFSIPC